MRRLFNTKETISQSRKDQIVDEFSLKLLRSGYSISSARQVLISGIRCLQRKVSHAKESGVPLHRSAQSTLGSRLKKKLTEKSSWFKGSKKAQPGVKNFTKSSHVTSASQVPQVKTVMFVPRTNDSKLCKQLRVAEENLSRITGYRCAIKERNGTQIRRLLCVKNPSSSHVADHLALFAKEGSLNQIAGEEILSI